MIETEPEEIVDVPETEDLPQDILEEIYGPGNAPPPTITPADTGNLGKPEESEGSDLGDAPTV